MDFFNSESHVYINVRKITLGLNDEAQIGHSHYQKNETIMTQLISYEINHKF